CYIKQVDSWTLESDGQQWSGHKLADFVKLFSITENIILVSEKKYSRLFDSGKNLRLIIEQRVQKEIEYLSEFFSKNVVYDGFYSGVIGSCVFKAMPNIHIKYLETEATRGVFYKN